MTQNSEEITLNEIDRIVYIWARYSGIRCPEPKGKEYSKLDLDDLIERLQRYRKDPNSFDEGFEKEEEDD